MPTCCVVDSEASKRTGRCLTPEVMHNSGMTVERVRATVEEEGVQEEVSVPLEQWKIHTN
jgi:hypothetical protein